MDSGDQNTPESTACEMKRLKKGGSGTPYYIFIVMIKERERLRKEKGKIVRDKCDKKV